jgi:alpha-beta hydrolase superfamily lysophospholipase
MSAAFRSLWSNPGTCVALVVLVTFVLLNVLAYRQARAMTRYAESTKPAVKPEDLSLLGKLRALSCGLLVPKPSRDVTPADVGLEYEKHTVTGGSLALEAWYVPHAGDRGLVLLFHGYTRCKADLLPEARALHAMGYACLLVDFRGCGGSEGDATTIGYHEADDVAHAVGHARRLWPGRRLILFGQSMGAAAVLRAFAVHRIAVDAAVLECPFDRLLTTVKVRFAAMGLPATPGAHLLTFWGGVQNGFNAFAHNPVAYAAAVACPVLLLYGSADARVSDRETAEIYGRFGGVKRLYVFEGLGHESYAGQRPEVWQEEVGRFLAGEAVAARPDKRTA